MGYNREHAIIVHHFDMERLIGARNMAISTCGNLVSEIVKASVNGTASFFVAPDGSKEGWEASHKGDRGRDAFVAWLRKQVYKGGNPKLRWVEVMFADDNGQVEITRDSDAAIRADAASLAPQPSEPAQINDGGPAFPQVKGRCGTTIRDYFAAKAMAGLLAADAGSGQRWAPAGASADEQPGGGKWLSPNGLAKQAYAIADAMLAARGGAK